MATKTKTTGRTVMTRKGQITVPVEIRRALGLREGDMVEVEYDEERCEARIRPAESVADRLYGSVKLREPVSDKELRRRAMEDMARDAMQEGR